MKVESSDANCANQKSASARVECKIIMQVVVVVAESFFVHFYNQTKTLN